MGKSLFGISPKNPWTNNQIFWCVVVWIIFIAISGVYFLEYPLPKEILATRWVFESSIILYIAGVGAYALWLDGSICWFKDRNTPLKWKRTFLVTSALISVIIVTVFHLLLIACASLLLRYNLV